jgi:hypothetical protein
MTNKNIAYERAMQQIGDIQTYVESIDNMPRELIKSIVQDLDIIASEVEYSEAFNDVIQDVKDMTVDFSTTDCGDIYVPTVENDDE